MVSQIFWHTLYYYLYCITDYHEQFDFNNRLKLHTVDWGAFIQGDVGSNNQKHYVFLVPGACVLLRSGEAQTAEDNLEPLRAYPRGPSTYLEPVHINIFLNCPKDLEQHTVLSHLIASDH